MRASRLAVLFAGVALAAFAAWPAWQMGRFLWETLDDPANNRRFDQRAWFAWKPGNLQNNARWEMTDDLKQRVLHPGMTRRQVLVLLGRPEDGMTNAAFTYLVGDDGADAVLFLVTFNPATGRLQAARLVFT